MHPSTANRTACVLRKLGRPRTVPLTPRARAALDAGLSLNYYQVRRDLKQASASTTCATPA